jgi:diacylglycerol O-acyltransferase
VPNLVQAVKLGLRCITISRSPTSGPQIPLYLLGCEMQATYPVVPLFASVGLVVGLFSYNGGLFWGFTADWESMPDLHDFVVAIEESFAELQRCAAALAEPQPRRVKKRRTAPHRGQRVAQAKRS